MHTALEYDIVRELRAHGDYGIHLEPFEREPEGYYLHVLDDDGSRLATAEILPDGRTLRSLRSLTGMVVGAVMGSDQALIDLIEGVADRHASA